MKSLPTRITNPYFLLHIKLCKIFLSQEKLLVSQKNKNGLVQDCELGINLGSAIGWVKHDSFN